MILTQKEIEQNRSAWENKKLVFTNGCFDIIHRGHLSYLNKAKSLGDFLVIGLNTDASVKRIKGEKRPIIAEKDRAFLLDNLKAVDAVIFFDEETPLELIKKLRPSVLVKGADYQKSAVVGADFVEQNGGRVELIHFEDGFSTSAIIERIKNL